MSSLRIVFAGSPAAAVPSLELLAASEHEVALGHHPARYPAGPQGRAHPDAGRRAGRGARASRCSAPRRLAGEPTEAVQELRPDLGVIVAYGALVREPLLSPCRALAGSTCTSRSSRAGAVRRRCSTRSSAGDDVTGASVFQLVPELDAGRRLRRGHRADRSARRPPAACSPSSPTQGRICSAQASSMTLAEGTADRRGASSARVDLRPQARAWRMARSTGTAARRRGEPSHPRRHAGTRGPHHRRRQARLKVLEAGDRARRRPTWHPASIDLVGTLRSGRHGDPADRAAARCIRRRPQRDGCRCLVARPPAWPGGRLMTRDGCAHRSAFDVIRAVRESDAYANLLLPVRIDRAKLSTADAGLATELTYGTLRMQGLYDAVIALAARRPVTEIDPPIVDVLRMAVPPAAARCASRRMRPSTSRWSSLAPWVRGRPSGFVNGVLRTISRSDARRVDRRCGGDGEARRGGARASVLPPAAGSCVRSARCSIAEGREGELESLLAADNVPPRVYARGPAAAWRRWRSWMPGHRRTRPSRAQLSGGDPGDVARSARGPRQCAGRGLAARGAGARAGRRPIVAGERWLDLCAGPGGKAALLAAEAGARRCDARRQRTRACARASWFGDALAALPEPA